MNVYDFDKTIYDGDSSIDFFLYSLRKNRKIFLNIFSILYSFFLYKLKIITKEKFKTTFFSFVKKIDAIKYAEEFWKENKKKIKLFYLSQHQKTDIIISASPSFFLEPIAKELNFNLIATEMNPKTGEIIGKNCYGEEKVKRLKSKGINKYEKFYSDSLSDTPCSKLAKEAYLVKKEKIIKWP